MEFESKPQEECYWEVHRWLRELFGEEFTHANPELPVIVTVTLDHYAHTTVVDWGDGDVLVATRALVARGPEVNTQLLEFLLRENDDMALGAFSLDEDGDVVFEHVLPGPGVTKGALRHSVLAVLNTARHYGERIVSRWGGRLPADTGDGE